MMLVQKYYKYVDALIEVSIYIYFVLMFLTMGEGIRNVLLYGNFLLWLLTVRHRANLDALKSPLALLLYANLGIAALSALFSIDPLYSLKWLRKDIIKALFLFVVMATVLSDEVRLKRAALVLCLTSALIMSVGYYSFFVYNMEVLKPITPLMHAWHDRYARYANSLIPFFFMAAMIWRGRWARGAIFIGGAAAVVSVVLTTSRGGYAGLAAACFMWLMYMSAKMGISMKKTIPAAFIACLLIIGTAWVTVPGVKSRLLLLRTQLPSVNNRMDTWEKSVEAVKTRPVLGLGYGERIFFDPEVYAKTFFKTPPVTGPESTFILVLYHQGFVGLAAYLILLAYAAKTFWLGAMKLEGISGYAAAACLCVIFGNYFVHSIVAELFFRHLVVILAIGAAAMNNRRSVSPATPLSLRRGGRG
jgi:O-antigen ligase